MQFVLKIVFFESPLLIVLACLLAMVGGLFAGSQIHTAAWAMTHDTEEGKTNYCRACGHEMSGRDALPLVGWVANNGLCPRCAAPLGVDRPGTELLAAVIFASIVVRNGISLVTFEELAFVSSLLVLSLASLWSYLVPNNCIRAALIIRVVYLIVLGILGNPIDELFVSAVVGALALGIPLALAVFLANAMLQRDVVGMGTVKLAAVVGFYLGWQQGLFALAMGVMLWAFVWLLMPNKLLEVDVSGSTHRDESPDAPPMQDPNELHATLEEDIAEPMRVMPLAPAIAIGCWIMLLLGVVPAVWNAPVF